MNNKCIGINYDTKSVGYMYVAYEHWNIYQLDLQSLNPMQVMLDIKFKYAEQYVDVKTDNATMLD